MRDGQTRRTYSSPTLKPLTPEQAKLLLLGHASQGNTAAKELLEVFFADPNHLEQSSPRNNGERERGFVGSPPVTSLSFLRRFTAEFKDGMWRLIRG